MKRHYAYRARWKCLLASVLDAAGDFLVRRVSSPIELSSLKNILVVRLDHIGDVVCALPLLRHLAERRDGPRLTVAVSSTCAPLVRDLAGVHEILIFDAPWYCRTPGRLMPSTRWHDFVAKIRERKFDAVLEPRGDARHLLMYWLAKIPIRIGYGNTGGGFLLTHELAWQKELHAADQNLRLLEVFGEHASQTQPHLPWQARPQEVQWLSSQVDRLPFLTLHADAGTAAKKWPLAYFCELLRSDRFQNKSVVLIGSNRDIGAHLLREVPERHLIDMTGQTTMAQLLTLIQASDHLISTDSGPAHLAAALGIPTFILWSGTNLPERWAPRGQHVQWVRHEVSCQNCAQERCPLPRQLCMQDLSVVEVQKGLTHFLPITST